MNRPMLKAMALLAVPVVVLTLTPLAFAEPSFNSDPAGIMQDFPDPPDNGFDIGYGPDGFDPPPHENEELAEYGPGARREGMDGRGQMGGRKQEMMNRRGGMTPEQMQAIKALHQQGKAENQAIQSRIKAQRQALMQYMQNPDANEGQARAMMNDLHNLQKQASDLRLRTFFEMRSKMTPEQRQQFMQMKRGGMQGEGGRKFQQGGGGDRFNPGQGGR